MARVYVEQYGGWWSMPREVWQRIARRMADGGEYDFDTEPGVRRIKRAPVSYWECYVGCNPADIPGIHVMRPLDWDQDDWTYAAEHA